MYGGEAQTDGLLPLLVLVLLLLLLVFAFCLLGSGRRDLAASVFVFKHKYLFSLGFCWRTTIAIAILWKTG